MERKIKRILESLFRKVKQLDIESSRFVFEESENKSSTLNNYFINNKIYFFSINGTYFKFKKLNDFVKAKQRNNPVKLNYFKN